MFRLRAFTLLLFCLTIVGPCLADSLLVSFSTAFIYFAPLETVSGSFLWDTSAQSFSDIQINSSGPYTFLPEIDFVIFADANDPFHRPVGSIIRLDFPDVTRTNFFVFDYNQHAGLDTPILPFPSTPSAEFFMLGALAAQNGSVTVTEAPVSTPEPSVLLLMLGPLVFFALNRMVCPRPTCSQ